MVGTWTRNSSGKWQGKAPVGFLNEIVQSRRQDNVFLDKEENQCFIVDRLDIAVPRDARIAEKEKEKTENY